MEKIDFNPRIRSIISQDIIDHLNKIIPVVEDRNVSTTMLKGLIKPMKAGKFMSECLKALPKTFELPNSYNVQGMLFWPIPLFSPKILAKALYRLEDEITGMRMSSNWKEAAELVEARKIFVEISCGQGVLEEEKTSDLSGDHCSVFLKDHPKIANIDMDYQYLPWSDFCMYLLSERNSVMKVLGMISDNENGSEDEQYALVQNGIIKSGKFFELHTVAEVEHANLAKKMESIFLSNDNWTRDFLIGKILHRIEYAKATGVLLYK